MTADTPLRLERWLGVSATFWMNLQKRYELDIARTKMGDTVSMIKPIHYTNPDADARPAFGKRQPPFLPVSA